MMKMLVRALAGLLLVAVTAPTAAAASPDTSEILLFKDARAEISYRYVNTDGSRYHAEISIANVSDRDISNWNLLMDLGYTVTDTSSVTLMSQRGREVVFGSDKAHSVIKPGHTVQFKFWADAAGDIDVSPPGFVFPLEDGVLPDTDTDGDLLPDYVEQHWGTNPAAADSDGDGLSDYVEWVIGTDAQIVDTDGNGVPDGQEDADGRARAATRSSTSKRSQLVRIFSMATPTTMAWPTGTRALGTRIRWLLTPIPMASATAWKSRLVPIRWCPTATLT